MDPIRDLWCRGRTLVLALGLLVASEGCESSSKQSPTQSPRASPSTPDGTSTMPALATTASTLSPVPTTRSTRAASRVVLEAESSAGSAPVMQRGNAGNQMTVRLFAGGSLTLRFDNAASARYGVTVRYSNDGPGTSPEQVDVSVDGNSLGQFRAENTRAQGLMAGAGWNEFMVSESLGPVDLVPGPHAVVLTVSGGDQYGAEIDVVTLTSS